MLYPHTGNEYIIKIAKVPWKTGKKDGHIILPLRVFDPVACSRISCAQLRTALFLSPKSDGDKHTEIQRDREMERNIYRRTDI